MKEVGARLRYLYALIASLLFVLLAVALVLVFDWSWWVGLTLVLLLAGLALGGIFLVMVWLGRRERRSTTERDPAGNKEQQGESGVSSLQQLWEAAVGTLRHSHLGKNGNPLYALPWYLMIGASGAGKSSVLRNARLLYPLGVAPQDLGLAGTRQCEWHFLQQAVVIDTAGRYAVPVSGERDQEEWRKFLSLLVRYRRKEPLNGLIVVVAADCLLGAGDLRLESEGAQTRLRIDELMRASGVRVPIYLLVTKCDLVPGMQSFCARLPAQSLDRPMGVMQHEQAQDAGAFVERALQVIEERLRDLRLQLLHLPSHQGAAPELLLLPQEFVRLREGLVSFATHAFGANPYQETPLLRGLFFGSSRQEGRPLGQVSSTMRLEETGELLPCTEKGLFLHDFLSEVLLLDRIGLAPTRKFLQWRTLTGNLGLGSWVLLGVALCGLLSISFVKNLNAIRDFSRGIAKMPLLRGDLPADLSTMERFRLEIQKVEERNRNWWIPRFGLIESLKVERGLKERFCRQFQSQILAPAQQQMEAGLAALSPATPDDLYAGYLVHLTRRINLLKTRLHDNSLEALQTKPKPNYSAFDIPAAAGTPDASRVFGNLYLSFLLWREGSGAVARELAKLQSSLTQLMALKGGQLQWSAAWVNRQSGLPALTLGDFWGGTLTVPGEKKVLPAFTRKGKAALDDLVRELEAAVSDSASLAAQKAALAQWHSSSSLEAWRDFAANFPRGEESLRGPSEWQQAASRMASEQGPYFELMNRMVGELEPMAGESAPPPWLQQVHQFQGARARTFLPDNPALNKAAEGGKNILSSIRRNVGQQAGAHKLEAQTSETRACREYCGALRAITPAVASRSQAFQLASQTFGEEAATGKSPFYAGFSAAGRLKGGISGLPPDPIFGRLINGPLEFLWSYLRKESACQLQGLWEEQVLAATAGMSSQQAIPALLGPDGLAWRFVKGPAAPFLARSLSGYGPKETLGGKVPFEHAFFSFMGQGVRTQAIVMALGRPQNYTVGIRGLPTDANIEAKVKPHATRIEVQCGGTGQSLVNNNYPVGKTISWSPDACGEVTFQIEIGSVVLTRHYLGPQGFPDFLRDLRGGRRTFSAREFPGERSALAQMGVTSVTVHYQLIGSAAVLQQSVALSGVAPRTIARSW